MLFPTMSVNIEITKKKNESNTSLLKRFSRKVQESGVIQQSKGNRYAKRNPSSFTIKKNKLKSLEKRGKIEKMIKLGKMAPRSPRGRK